MESYRYLLDIAIILLFTKAFGIFSKKLRMPSVVGALIAGIVLGPAVLNIVEPSNLISALSEIGVIVLMFSAGLETSITDLKKAGFKAFIIALFGVLIPLAVGYLIGMIYNVGPQAWIENLFIGVIFTATSVGITVETLKEMHCMSTESGNVILAAAVIDDVLGIVCLTLVTGMADSSVNVGVVLLKILGFFIFSIIVGVIMHKVFNGGSVTIRTMVCSDIRSYPSRSPSSWLTAPKSSSVLPTSPAALLLVSLFPEPRKANM